ncbi:hypothetical protein IV203_011427 [Nitzschia inconspicua]|uniref:Uncharacterized protein n=1 Tax=Nitzschia inconspicua TaxID=303405 RepID=A0A9K3KS34_9STRA|nr:hypothetical protein IV203_011427 [Nitzschia inconspicua]
MHHLPPRRGGICRSDSQVSALSTPSCLFSSCPDEGTENRPDSTDEDGESSMYASDVVCNRLRDSSHSHNNNNNNTTSLGKERIRRRTVAANTSSKNQKQRRTKNNSRISSSSSSKRSEAVVRGLISSVSFKDTGYDDDQDTDGDCNSTVSSLGMGFLYESGDEGDFSVAADRSSSSRNRQSDTNHIPKNHSSRPQQEDHQDDEISNLRFQIRMLRRSSMERFQANSLGGNFGTASKYDSTPCLPSSPREEGDCRISTPCTKQQEGSERSSSIPSPTSVTAFDATISVSTTNHIRRRSSLPSDLSKILLLESPSTTMGSSIASNSALKTTLAPKSRITRTDRWSCTACSETLLRDTELVKQSFERILSLRKERHIKDLELTMLHQLLDTDSEDISVRPSCSALSSSSSTRQSRNNDNNSPPTIPQRRSEKLSTTA